MLGLNRGRRYVFLLGGDEFLWGWLGLDAARPAVEADIGDVRIVDDGLVVDVRDVDGAEIAHCPVVHEDSALPVAALEANAAIAEAVIDAAIEPNRVVYRQLEVL
jgi:hypothetical protein